MQGCATFCASALFAFIVFLVEAMFDAQRRSDQKKPLDPIHKLSPSYMLSLVRTTQAILSLLTTFTLSNTFQYLQWTMSSRRQGLSYTSLLALSPTTGPLGMLCLILSSSTKVSSRAWAIMR